MSALTAACLSRSPPPIGGLDQLTCQPQCCVGFENVCLDNLDGSTTADGVRHSSFLGLLLELFILLYSFTAVAIVADEHLVVSLETLCVRWNVREDVAGASFMAFGSAAPEIIINAVSTLKAVISMGGSTESSSMSNLPHGCRCDKSCEGEDEALGIGAIIGSGMIAFTFIPGCCGLAAKEPLELKRRPLIRDILAYSLALIILMVALADGRIEASESVGMVALYLVYLVIVIFSSKVRETYRVKVLGRAARNKGSFVTQNLQETLNPMAQSDAVALPTLQQPPSTPTSATRNTAALDRARASGGGGGGEQPSVAPLSLTSPPPSPPEDSAPRFDGLTPNAVTINPGTQGGGDDDDDGPSWLDKLPHPLAKAAHFISKACSASLIPLKFALKYTCPECAHDSPTAKSYPITLCTSFTWVAIMSTIIAAVVSRWGELLCIPSSFLGMYVVAIGAEIPDTIQSVTVARRGYGSMAVSNSCGSQIINILIGLGLPWLITNMAGKQITVKGVAPLRLMAGFQFGNVATYTAFLVLPTIQTWRPGDHSKASLGKQKGGLLLCWYLAVLIICAPLLLGISSTRD